jgi:hypothetical protein
MLKTRNWRWVTSGIVRRDIIEDYITGGGWGNEDGDQKRLRPERGDGVKPGEAGPPRESERGWGPASTEKG